MSARLTELKDTETRLTGKTAAGASVHRSRGLNTSPDDLPAILLYAPDEDGTPIGAGHPQFNLSITLAVEVRVAATGDWDTAAAALMDEVKTTLFTDPDWTRRWAKPISYRIRQYIEAKGERPLCGEVMTLSLEPAATDEYQPVAQPELANVTFDIDLTVPTPDGVADVTVVAVSPPA